MRKECVGGDGVVGGAGVGWEGGGGMRGCTVMDEEKL